MISYDNLFLLIAIGGGLLFWANAVDCRSRARTAALKACSDAGVKFIDELSLKKLRPGRGDRGQPVLLREYRFEFFMSGNLRYDGQISLRGRRVTRVEMSPRPFDPEA